MNGSRLVLGVIGALTIPAMLPRGSRALTLIPGYGPKRVVNPYFARQTPEFAPYCDGVDPWVVYARNDVDEYESILVLIDAGLDPLHLESDRDQASRVITMMGPTMMVNHSVLGDSVWKFETVCVQHDHDDGVTSFVYMQKTVRKKARQWDIGFAAPMLLVRSGERVVRMRERSSTEIQEVANRIVWTMNLAMMEGHVMPVIP